MEMGQHDIDVAIAAYFLHLSYDRLTVARTEAGVDHQCRAAAHDDSDVRYRPDIVVRNRPDMLRQMDCRVLSDQWCRRLLGESDSVHTDRHPDETEETECSRSGHWMVT